MAIVRRFRRSAKTLYYKYVLRCGRDRKNADKRREGDKATKGEREGIKRGRD